MNNPHSYADPSGEFTIIEINFTSAMHGGQQTFRTAAINYGRKKALKRLGEAVKDEVVKQVRDLLPVDDLLASFEQGVKLGDILRRTICNSLHVPENMFFEVPITGDGRPLANGFTCNEDVDPSEVLRMARLGVPRPDFIIGSRPPHAAGSFPKTWVIGEIKATTATLYSDYIAPGRNTGQLWSIVNYASKHTYSRTALFITGVKGANPPKDEVLILEIGKSTLSKGVLPVVVRIVD